MIRLFFGIIVLFFALPAWSQQGSFTGRVALDKTISSFETENPVPGTLYLLTGSAGAIRLLSDSPFGAEVDFVEAQWLSEKDLVASRVLLSFEGDAWAQTVLNKKPKTGGDLQVYPYRKFQVAAVFEKLVHTADGPVPRFRVIDIPLLF